MTDRNCLSFWFPLIRDAGLPLPRTKIVKTDIHLSKLLDGKTPEGWGDFLAQLANAGWVVGYPLFLRTGQGSGKHQWQKTCYVRQSATKIASGAKLGRHVYNLVEWSECAGMMGLPYNVWAVREMLPTRPVCVLPNYGNMPLCREFRCFVRDGELQCLHGYWPWEAVCDGFPRKEGPEGFEWINEDSGMCRQVPDGLEQVWEGLCHLSYPERAQVEDLAERAGKAVGAGYWSVDILGTHHGWFVTDMALGEQSFHWPDCEFAAKPPSIADD